MSQTKVKSGLLNFPDQTDFVKLPSGTTAQRPSSPEEGYSRYNTTDNKLEYWNGTEWQQLPGLTPPIITSISYPSDDLAADPDGGQTITINGGDFKAGATVTVDGTTPSVITFVSAIEITFTAPPKTSGDYDIVVTNVDGGNATAIDAITYNGLPSWTTPAGNLGTFPAGSTIPTITLVATEPDSGVVSYSVTTGALPSGLTLTGADIDGTVPTPAGETTYNFSVTASDDENQESTERAFNIVVYIPLPPTFNTVTWTGDSSTNRQITGVGFAPDLVWIKNRDRSSSHAIFDTVRGATKFLSSTLTDSEQTYTNTLSAFGSDGFTVNESSAVNQTGEGIVAWCWKAAGYANTFNVLENEAVTTGSTASSVGISTTGSNSTLVGASINKDAGFSITTHSIGGSYPEWISHGLGVIPDLVITKPRDTNEGWIVNIGPGVIDSNDWTMNLNTTNAANINGRQMTSTVVPLTYTPQNQTFVSYAFKSVSEVSNIGSYTGTGASGNTVDVGFEPAFIMIKRTEGSGEWIMFDNKRETTSIKQDTLAADSSRAEGTNVNYEIEFLSNGFSVNGTSAGVNASPETYIYMAFANQY